MDDYWEDTEEDSSTAPATQPSNEEVLTAKSIDKLAKPVAVPDDNQLQYAYSFWYTQLSRGSVSSTPSDYEDQIKHVYSFATVEQFWAGYCHMNQSTDLPHYTTVHLFKMGIKPMWEDEANRKGGKWIVRLRKAISPRCWENLILAMLGEQFIVGNEVCGAVISVRPTEDIISLWNRTAKDSNITSRIRDTLWRVMQLPPNTVLEYKAHDQSIKDKSSFRNTDVFVR